VELLQELNEQRKENQELKQKIQEYTQSKENEIKLDSLAGLEDYIEVNGSYSAPKVGTSNWKIRMKWAELFNLLSPFLLDHPNDVIFEKTLSQELFKKVEKIGYTPNIDKQIYQTIKIHLSLLGLVKVDYLKTTQGGMNLFWSLTETGVKLMYELRSVKK